MFAKERLYLNAAKTAVVANGDPEAAFLYASIGDEIPDSAADRFGLVDGRLKKPTRRTSEDTLIGSSLLPSKVPLAKGGTVPLGNVVAKAYKASGLSLEAWNLLPDADREDRLKQAIAGINASQAAGSGDAGAGKNGKRGAKVVKPSGDKENKAGENKGGAAGPGQPV
jgi:hypothetical protein